MKKALTFRVTVFVDDRGQLNERYLRQGIEHGISMSCNEGVLTDPDDVSTEVVSWNVLHISTNLSDF